MSEIDDTPGSRVPTEWLDESPTGAAVLRRRQRLRMAYSLFCSILAGSWGQAVGPGNSTGKLRRWCWEQADAFIGEGDRTPTPTDVAVALGPPLGHQRVYLEWLRDHDGSCLTRQSPPGMAPPTAADVRRHLHNRGLIAATHKGGAVEATGWALTAAGWDAVGGPELAPASGGGVPPAERAA